MRLIFFGSPDFAVPSLKKLYELNHKIAAVVTAPDKPKGRGQKIMPMPVKIAALKLNLPVLQPAKLSDPEFKKEVTAINPDLNVVVAFRIMPEWLINLPRLGSINLHASLLPKYRGAAPINWVLINGEKITGLTTFILKKEVDTGDILLQEEIEISENDNYGSLHDKMAVIGAELISRTIDGLESKTLFPRPQGTGQFPTAPKLTPEIGKIDWSKSARMIVNLVRGLSPYPAAYSFLKNKRLSIIRAMVSQKKISEKHGVIISADVKSGLDVACGDGAVTLLEVKPEARKVMSAVEFIRGYDVKVGYAFES